jgi:hypothetical protein
VSAGQREELAQRLFGRIVLDLDTGRIKEIHLREELEPLFAALPE